MRGRFNNANYTISGNIEASKKFNFELEVIPQFKYKLNNYSSTEIRNKIKNGNVIEGSKLIGNNYNFYANRVSGNGFGRKIGFPTINFKNLFKNQFHLIFILIDVFFL